MKNYPVCNELNVYVMLDFKFSAIICHYQFCKFLSLILQEGETSGIMGYVNKAFKSDEEPTKTYPVSRAVEMKVTVHTSRSII